MNPSTINQYPYRKRSVGHRNIQREDHMRTLPTRNRGDARATGFLELGGLKDTDTE